MLAEHVNPMQVLGGQRGAEMERMFHEQALLALRFAPMHALHMHHNGH